MLRMDPNERFTCKKCLDEPWFNDVREIMTEQEKEIWKEFGDSGVPLKHRSSPTPG